MLYCPVKYYKYIHLSSVQSFRFFVFINDMDIYTTLSQSEISQQLLDNVGAISLFYTVNTRDTKHYTKHLVEWQD